ncbi:cytochrome P450 [Streptomyces sp. NBC_01278]|uniref:cytochrome P450 n=1 Tax=Streptomyces sp. NBC_01278 TaxID=2903809 RepID=UPI002E2F88F9|nr:cytochrome P450 [Streptomyces sp. NBC_01278]
MSEAAAGSAATTETATATEGGAGGGAGGGAAAGTPAAEGTGAGSTAAAALPVPRPARAGRAETVRFAATHTLPAFVRGAFHLRPRVVAAYAALGQQGWSAATLRAMRARHGGAPVEVRGLSGPLLVLLDHADVRRFYELPVRILAMDAPDKYKGLSLLEPTGVICSHGDTREERRRVNDDVLAADRPVHPSCAEFQAVIAQEATALVQGSELDFPLLRRTVARIGRRMVLGDAAAGDEELARWLLAIREEANWMRMRKGRAAAAEAVYRKAAARVEEYAARAEPHTLAALARSHPAASGPGAAALDAVGQAHHWLLALDTVGPTVARTLLLLAAHPAEQEALRAELDGGGAELPRLRACVQETLRLFPIVPDLVRVTRAETQWRGVHYPPGTAVLVPALFHQRDPEHVPAAHQFVPARWLRAGAAQDTRMAPFSHGGGRCPGEHLGVLTAAELTAAVLRGHRVTGGRPAVDPCLPLPGILSSAGIRLTLAQR